MNQTSVLETAFIKGGEGDEFSFLLKELEPSATTEIKGHGRVTPRGRACA